MVCGSGWLGQLDLLCCVSLMPRCLSVACGLMWNKLQNWGLFMQKPCSIPWLSMLQYLASNVCVLQPAATACMARPRCCCGVSYQAAGCAAHDIDAAPEEQLQPLPWLFSAAEVCCCALAWSVHLAACPARLVMTAVARAAQAQCAACNSII